MFEVIKNEKSLFSKNISLLSNVIILTVKHTQHKCIKLKVLEIIKQIMD